MDWGKQQRFWSVKHGKDLSKERRKGKHWLIHSVLAYLHLGRYCSKHFRSAVLVQLGCVTRCHKPGSLQTRETYFS